MDRDDWFEDDNLDYTPPDYDLYGDEDDERDKWTCAYPGKCAMPAEHMRSECHMAAEYDALYDSGLRT